MIFGGFQRLVKDGNERQVRYWAGVARWRRIAATSRREYSGGGSSTRRGIPPDVPEPAVPNPVARHAGPAQLSILTCLLSEKVWPEASQVITSTRYRPFGCTVVSHEKVSAKFDGLASSTFVTT